LAHVAWPAASSSLLRLRLRALHSSTPSSSSLYAPSCAMRRPLRPSCSPSSASSAAPSSASASSFCAVFGAKKWQNRGRKWRNRHLYSKFVRPNALFDRKNCGRTVEEYGWPNHQPKLNVFMLYAVQMHACAMPHPCARHTIPSATTVPCVACPPPQPPPVPPVARVVQI